MTDPAITHEQVQPLQVACLAAVIDKRADILPLFDLLRPICGSAVCGPPTALIHYGAVKDGLLVEAAFPVSRPVEADDVHTRLLDGGRAWATIHRGPHDTMREATMRVLDYVEQHAGTIGGGVREIYAVLDAAQPENNVTELLVMRHEWDRLLAQGVESVLGAASRKQVMRGIEQITVESPAEAYREWIRGAMGRLDALTADPRAKYQAVSCCAHVFPQARIDHLRAIYAERGELDDVLREMYEDPAWYEDPVRRGNKLYVRKVPFNPEGYAQGATAAERRQAYCHCAFVRPYLDTVPAGMSPTFCWCGAGWYRHLWEGLLGRPIQVEHVETLIQGHDGCTLEITLPLEIEGEMAPPARG
jgi:hypothetical protein